MPVARSYGTYLPLGLPICHDLRHRCIPTTVCSTSGGGDLSVMALLYADGETIHPFHDLEPLLRHISADIPSYPYEGLSPRICDAA